jgi:hypothetical protein
MLQILLPQLIGIVAGCIVFLITLLVVFYLLYKSGALFNAFPELLKGSPSSAVIQQSATDFSIAEYPELYEKLLNARSSLPIEPNPPDLLVSISCIGIE